MNERVFEARARNRRRALCFQEEHETKKRALEVANKLWPAFRDTWDQIALRQKQILASETPELDDATAVWKDYISKIRDEDHDKRLPAIGEKVLKILTERLRMFR